MKIKVYDKREMFKYLFTVLKNGRSETFTFNKPRKMCDGLYINKEPSAYVCAIGAVLCCITKMYSNEGYAYMIVYDKYFESLPKVVKEFLLWHEVGHAVHGDLENPKNSGNKRAKTMLKRSFVLLPQEAKADEFSASKIGIDNAISALRFLVRRTNLPLLSKVELTKRIVNLKKAR